MSQVRTFRKGDVIFREGDKINFVHMIQSGSVSLCLIKNKKHIDLFLLGPSAVLGEQIIAGTTTYLTSAIATVETKVLEVPAELFKVQFDALPSSMKMLSKSLVDRLKIASNEMRNMKNDKDAIPCPEDQVAKVFGSLYHAIRHKGVEANGELTVDWVALRQYGQRIFGESHKRTEQACQIMVKMKAGEFLMEPPVDDPEGAPEIRSFKLTKPGALEAFFEFYQYYYFKGGKSELLKVNDDCFMILKHLLHLVKAEAPDRFGIVSIDFAVVLDSFKDDLGIQLGNGHFSLLESKGLFAKRKTTSDNKVLLQFELKEFATQLEIWRILREIDKWNERGFVDMADLEEPTRKKVASGKECPACKAEVQPQAKFCGECGHKLVAEDKKAA